MTKTKFCHLFEKKNIKKLVQVNAQAFRMFVLCHSKVQFVFSYNRVCTILLCHMVRKIELIRLDGR